MAKHGASLHKAKLKPGRKIKIQIATKNRPIADGLSEIAKALNEAAPDLLKIEETTGNPHGFQGMQVAYFKGRSITKKGILTLWYEIGSKA